MFKLTYEDKFSSAHYIPEHKGKCRNLHGHTWKVRIEVVTNFLENHMVIDFGELKKLISEYDHCNLNKDVILEVPPTAERLAQHLHEDVMALFTERAGQVKVKVTLWESDNASIEYSE